MPRTLSRRTKKIRICGCCYALLQGCKTPIQFPPGRPGSLPVDAIVRFPHGIEGSSHHVVFAQAGTTRGEGPDGANFRPTLNFWDWRVGGTWVWVGRQGPDGGRRFHSWISAPSPVYTPPGGAAGGWVSLWQTSRLKNFPRRASPWPARVTMGGADLRCKNILWKHDFPAPADSGHSHFARTPRRQRSICSTGATVACPAKRALYESFLADPPVLHTAGCGAWGAFVGTAPEGDVLPRRKEVGR